MGKDTNELQALQAEVAKITAEKEALRNQLSKKSNLESIREKAHTNRKDATVVKIKQFKDYDSMRLYHTNGVHVGKVVGPLHPDNAESTFMRFRAKGIILSVVKPTDEEIKAYQQTEEYKALNGDWTRTREKRNKTVKESEVSRLTKLLEKSSGKPILNAIKQQDA